MNTFNIFKINLDLDPKPNTLQKLLEKESKRFNQTFFYMLDTKCCINLVKNLYIDHFDRKISYSKDKEDLLFNSDNCFFDIKTSLISIIIVNLNILTLHGEKHNIQNFCCNLYKLIENNISDNDIKKHDYFQLVKEMEMKKLEVLTSHKDLIDEINIVRNEFIAHSSRAESKKSKFEMLFSSHKVIECEKLLEDLFDIINSFHSNLFTSELTFEIETDNGMNLLAELKEFQAYKAFVKEKNLMHDYLIWKSTNKN